MAKGKSNEKITYKKLLKEYTNGFCDNLNFLLKSVDTDTLITDLYLTSNCSSINDLIKEYEKQILLAKFNFPAFKSGAHMFFYNKYKEIKKNKTYYSFLSFFNYINIELYKKNLNENLLTAYMNMLLQQLSYFSTVDKIPYGIKTNGEIIYGSECVRGFNEISLKKLELAGEGKELSFPLAKKLLSKRGYILNDESDFARLIGYERIVYNQISDMNYFINENTEFLIPKVFYNPNNIPTLPSEVNKIENIDKIKERLSLRNILLPSNGLKVDFSDFGDVISLTLYEYYIDEKMFLLYNLEFKNNTPIVGNSETGSIYGFYSIKDKYFYSLLDGSNFKEIHTKLEKLILSVYTTFTCKLSENEKNDLCIIDISKYTLAVFQREEEIKSTEGKKIKFRNSDDFTQEIKQIQPYIRKLPSNMFASEESKEHARRLGIELPPNMTFVKEFSKKISRKK